MVGFLVIQSLLVLGYHVPGCLSSLWIQVCACLADVRADSAFWHHWCHCPKLLGSPDELGACFAGFSFTNLDAVWNNCSACPPCDAARRFFFTDLDQYACGLLVKMTCLF